MIKVKKNFEYCILFFMTSKFLYSEHFLLALEKSIDKFSSPISISLDHENYVLVLRTWGNRKRMPLKSFDRRNIDENILPWSIFIPFRSFDVDHDKLFVVRDRNVNDFERSEKHVPYHSWVMKDNYDQKHRNCEESQRPSPIEPKFTPMNNHQNQEQRKSNEMN